MPPRLCCLSETTPSPIGADALTETGILEEDPRACATREEAAATATLQVLVLIGMLIVRVFGHLWQKKKSWG